LEEKESIDISVQEQFEITFHKIIESIIQKTSLENIKGITYKNEYQ